MILRERGKDINAVRAVQQFIGEGTWDDDRILERHEHLVAEDLGEVDGTMIVEGSGFRRKASIRSACSRSIAGRWARSPIANRESLSSMSRVAATRLWIVGFYMPEAWFDEAYAAKRKKCGVSAELQFKTEPELGLEMISGLSKRGVVPLVG